MSAEQLVRYLTWIFYVGIFLVVAVRALREPHRSNINIALFFLLPALVILTSTLAELHFFGQSPLLPMFNGSLILTLSYVLLRLVDDFAALRPVMLRAAEASLILLIAALFVWDAPRPGWVTALQVFYFVALQLYAAVQFFRASYHTSGVTKRRMRAVAFGSVFLGIVIFVEVLTFLGDDVRDVLSQVLALASAISYFLGFAPPLILRRAWQEPELRAFLSRAARLPRLPSTDAIIDELEQGAATSLGAPHALVGLWEAESNQLHFEINGEGLEIPADTRAAVGKAFVTQQPVFVADAPHEYPDYAEASRRYGSQAILIAPITAGANRLGVLAVYAPRAPIFASDDLALVKLLADQAAVILESRSLIDEAARVQAREEATRLKDDFLSAAAHDLKTPLTALIGRAQLLERRALRKPDAPVDLQSLQILLAEAQRLRSLVLDLLDAARAERGQLVSIREPIDLASVAHEVCARHRGEHHTCVVDAMRPVVGDFDRNRIMQMLENLVENAVKYTPDGGSVDVKVWAANDEAHLTVSDRGLGIPASDLPHIFDRFFRARNVDDRRFSGMGLGLFICRAIAEQHGGRIGASARQGGGTTFHITLPCTATGDMEHG
jgi:signal transduction histidine kinase